MSALKIIAAASALTASSFIYPLLAHAGGLSSCKEDPGTLNAEAKKTIEIISEKVPLGQYETLSTVLQFVNKSLNGVDIKTECSEIMAYYADGRMDGSINAPEGPGLN
jgi:hypothetical protein